MQGGRFARPSTRSAYTYTPSGSSPARLASPCFGPFRYRPEPWPRLAPSGVRRGARGLGLSHAPCAAAPVVFAAIRAAMRCRRDTASSPCDVSHRASDEPCRRMSLSSALAPLSLASPSIRRVFLRSICARRRSVSSLNRARVSPGAKRSRRRRAQCGVRLPRRLARGPRRKRSAAERGHAKSTVARRRIWYNMLYEEVKIATKGLHRRGDGLRQEADA